MIKREKLHLFIATGITFTFSQVHILTDNESTLVFEYKAGSDNKFKRAVISKSKIVGFSTTTEKQ